jgi:Ca2+:H+ antiporter
LASIRHLFALSWLNILLIFVPFGISAQLAGLKNPTFIFALNAIAIVPLTMLLTYSTECVAQNLGNGIGAFLNITFGNLVEMVILCVRSQHLIE